MEGVILHYRLGANRQRENQVILEVEGITSRSEAARLIGRKVLWKHPVSGEVFRGKIVRVHGCKGRVVARFRKALPGQALGTRVVIV